MADWISVVEAAYSLEGDLGSWTSGVLEACAPHLDAGDGLVGCHFSRSANGCRIEQVVTRGILPPGQAVERIIAASGVAPLMAEACEKAWDFSSVSAALAERGSAAESAFRRFSQGRFADGWGGSANTGSGRGIAIGAPLRVPRRASAALQRHWSSVACHVGAGLRLRHALSQPGSADSALVDARLDPSGAVIDARGAATSKSAREALRAAVRGSDRARTRAGRVDPDAALALWQGLVAGRWSLIDRFETDGRRFIVAMRNDPEVPNPRGLCLREAQIGEYLGLGYSEKQIGYTLGLSIASVSRALHRALRKLGLATRAELAAVFASGGLHASMREIDLAGQPLALASAPLVDERAIGSLSSAEQAVATRAVRGESSEAIAARRGTSARTVENQLHAVYQKLGVHSREELATRLAATA